MIYYTDGSSKGNPGDGGWAYVSLHEGEIVEADFGYESNVTNNAMELTAILKVLERIYAIEANNDNFIKESYVIVSDSSYAINTISKWSISWALNGWRRPGNKPVENLELVKELYDYYITKNLQSQVFFTKVHGHCGVLENEICDALASANKTKYNSLIKKNNINDDVLYGRRDPPQEA